MPESQLIFRAESFDGSLLLTVWRDAEPLSRLRQELGGMGMLVVSGTQTGTIYRRERVAISGEATFGSGPTEEELERWADIMDEELNR